MTTQAQVVSTVHITHDVSIEPIFYRDQPVLTLAMIDQVHARSEGTARRNFNTNKERLIEGEDFFKVGADEIRTRLKIKLSKFANEDVTLLTESGYPASVWRGPVRWPSWHSMMRRKPTRPSAIRCRR